MPGKSFHRFSGSGERGGIVFSDQELARAINWRADLAGSRIGRAIRFQNSLHAFLRDADRAQSATPPFKILAIDPIEVIALSNFGTQHLKAFTFGDLLADLSLQDPLRGRLETLDRLVNYHLLHEQRNRALILDSYGDELASFKSRFDRWSATRLAISHDFGDLECLSQKQLAGIRDWLLRSRRGDRLKEWETFRCSFLPQWRESMFDELTNGLESHNLLREFLQSERYFWIRPGAFGAKSIVNELVRVGRSFDWADYEHYVVREGVMERFDAVRAAVVELLSTGADRHLLMDERDGEALAQIDLLNGYFRAHRENIKVELISRSPKIHDVLAALPGGRLRITVRHPLFVPEIYAFDNVSLASIGDCLGQVDGLVAPYTSPSSSDLDREVLLTRDDDEIYERVQEAARSVVPLLEDILSIQQSLDVGDPDFFEKVERRRNSDAQGKTPEAMEREVGETVRSLFNVLSIKVREREDPFSLSLFRSLIEQNKELSDFERERTFEEGSQLKLRWIDFYSQESAPAHRKDLDSEDFSVSPQEFIAIRPTGSAFRRLFHVHSTRLRDFIIKASAVYSNGIVPVAVGPREVSIDVGNLFSQLGRALDELLETNEQTMLDDTVYNLDATLLACLAFASRSRYDTAIALSSTVLHHVVSAIRRGQLSPLDRKYIRERLAYRELFLLRHYCERRLAVERALNADLMPRDPTGLVAKNFARAQRDLDFAALMSEEAERCLLGGSHTKGVSPAGVRLFSDSRLRLAHLGGWLDQFMVLIKGEVDGLSGWHELFDGTQKGLRKRIDMWTAVGLAKEASIVAYRAREARSKVDAADPKLVEKNRYLAHVEARALQGALTVFLVLLAYPYNSDLHVLWAAEKNIAPERILAFRSWWRWWEGCADLRNEFEFDMSFVRRFEVVFLALKSIDGIRNNQQLDLATKKGRGAKVIKDLEGSLRDIVKDISGASIFIRSICDQLLVRIADLSNFEGASKV